MIHTIRHERPIDHKTLLRPIIRSVGGINRPIFYAMLIIAAPLPVFTLQ